MKAFIFDFDGVIVDSERQWRKLGDEMFYPSLVPGWTKEDGARMMGLGLKAGHALLVAEYGLTMDYPEYYNQLGKLVDDIYFSKLTLLPGLENLITRLKTFNIPLGIGSSGEQSWIKRILEQFGLIHHFSTICSAESVNDRTKPAPDVYLLAAQHLGVDPISCVVLEDSTHGITAAKTAGMTCIAIQTDMSSMQDLSHADRIVRHYDELTQEVLEGF